MSEEELTWESHLVDYYSCPLCVGQIICVTEKDSEGKILNQYDTCNDLECNFHEPYIVNYEKYEGD